MSHGRKYGDKDSHPIPLWNGVFEHYGRIGDALWEFLWCVDAITTEKDGIGLVHGGAPVKLKRIVADLKADKETVRRHLKHLAGEKYIRVRRNPYGQIIEVLNSKKFGIWRKEKPQNAVSLPQEKLIHESEKLIHESEKPQNAVSKEDSAVTQQEDAAARHAAGGSGLWNLIGVRPEKMPPEFRKLCEQRYANKNGQPLGEFMGSCMDGWEELGRRQPREFAQRASAIREIERNPARTPQPDLEAEPWNTSR
jgi:DNA-binding MarR family transcriptional regulator